ncbi:MAG TPA: alpha/beta fold hydrolase [Actinomycetota bacterium]
MAIKDNLDQIGARLAGGHDDRKYNRDKRPTRARKRSVCGAVSWARSSRPADRSGDLTMPQPILADAKPFMFEGGEVGVLLLHGFTGSPQGLRLWGEALHRGGLTVHCPLLPGHGTHWRDLAITAYPAWEEASLAGLSLLTERCEQVVVCSLSFGGALALHLAAQRPHEVQGVVAVNPWLYLNDRRLALLPVLKHVVPTARGIGSDIADSPLRELAYKRVPLKALAAARALQALVTAELGKVAQPLLIYVSRQDHVVPPGNTTFIAERAASTDVEVVWLERSYHVATLDCERDLIFDGSLAFVHRMTGQRGKRSLQP